MPDNEKSNGGGSPRRTRRVGGTPSTSQQHVPSAPATSTETSEATGTTGPKASKRAERTAAFFFLLAGAGGIGFMIAYVTLDLGTIWELKWSNQMLGLSMAVAFFGMGIGMVIWSRHVMRDEEVEGLREPLPSSMEEKREFMEYFLDSGEGSGLKRPLLRRSLLAALVPLGIAPLFLLGGLGGGFPYRKGGHGMYHTVWRQGLRLVIYGTGEPIRSEDLASPGSILTVIPEGYEHELNVLADATVQIIKFRPDELKPPTRLDWVVDGIVAYSKICTHVGCATGLYEDTTHYILCPCHQSTFDASRGCEVVFGPAGHPLPQLPLGVDAEGYLVSTADFPVPPGPSFWGRG